MLQNKHFENDWQVNQKGFLKLYGISVYVEQTTYIKHVMILGQKNCMILQNT